MSGPNRSRSPSLAAGTRLGTYEILSPLGAGAMGEVYLARDTRLGRQVAIKILPPDLADSDRLRRFEREALAASALNHSSIVTIYEVGESGGTRFIAMEYVSGQTLRSRLAAGALPVRTLLDIAVPIAEGLTRAHEAGIVHRDLKPENIVVGRDGAAKILDFGLAKRRPFERGEANADARTDSLETEAGVILGTAAYMSPEQASGRAVDFRSDQFSFGCVLYEMATGTRAFQRATTAETLTAIIREEPDPPGSIDPRLPGPLQWIIERCLSKSPEDRYTATRDLGRDLADLRGRISQLPSGDRRQPAPGAASRWGAIVAVPAMALVLAAGAFWAGRSAAPSHPRTVERLTFRRGSLSAARYCPGGEVAYSAAWEAEPSDIYVTDRRDPVPRALKLPGAGLLAVSSRGELAVMLRRHLEQTWTSSGTLARVPLSGGPPREVLEGVEFADWSPDGRDLAVVRIVEGRRRLEYPIGTLLYETSGWIGQPRISPSADALAFLDHPILGDDRGSVVLILLKTRARKPLTRFWEAVQGLAWAPSGREIWFTASEQMSKSLHAVSLGGRERLVDRMTGSLFLHDVGADGRLLLTQDAITGAAPALASGETRQRDLEWLDGTVVWDISADGRSLLFSEEAEAGGAPVGVWVRPMDGGPAVRLGDGVAGSFSPDGAWTSATTIARVPQQIVLLPVRAGQPRMLTHDEINHDNVRFFPDGRRLLFAGEEPGRLRRLYVTDLSGAAPRPISPEGVGPDFAISPDGRAVAGIGRDGRIALFSTESGEERALPGIGPSYLPIVWSADGKSLYLQLMGKPLDQIFLYGVDSGRLEPWKEILPSDPAGIVACTHTRITPDGRAFAASMLRILSDLYEVRGVGPKP